MRDAILIAGVYIAAVIGAGFASGSEIVHYFLPFGYAGIFGILFACILFGTMAERLLYDARDAESFGACLEKSMPHIAAVGIEKLSLFFMAVLYVSMISGGSEILRELTGCEKGRLALLLCILSAIVFFFDLRGFVAVNNLLAVVMITGILSVCIYLLNGQTKHTAALGHALSSGGNYASYNILTAGAVVVSLGRGKKLPRGVCGVISGGMFFLMLTLLWLVLRCADEGVLTSQLPMLVLCRKQGGILYALYAAVLLSAMLTTAFCNGFCVLDQMTLPRPVGILLLVSFGYLFSGLEFSFLVDRVYRAAGFLGFLFLLCVLIHPVKKTKKSEK